MKTNPSESQLREGSSGCPGAGLLYGAAGLDTESAQRVSSLNRPRWVLALQPAVPGLLRGCWGLPTTSHPPEPPGAGQGQLQEGGGRGQWEGQRAANMEPGVGLKLQLFPLLFVWFLFLATAHVNLRIQSITAMNDVAVSPYPRRHLVVSVLYILF